MKDSDESIRLKIHFFVRPMVTGRTIVMTSVREEPLKSVLSRIAWVTGIPMTEQRVIYKGKQLELEKTVEECEIQNDSTLHLVGRLLSGGFPTAERIIDYMVFVLVHILQGGETVRFNLNIISVLTARNFGLAGFVEVFTASPGPSMLASLYMARGGAKHLGAEACVSHILNCCRSSGSQYFCTALVLKFCKELRKVGCESYDGLYVKCRSVLGFLLENVGLFYDSGTVKKRVLLRDVFSFIPELAERLLQGLDYSSKFPSSLKPSWEEVKEFRTFLKPLRIRIMEQQGLIDFSDVSDETGKWNVEEEEEEEEEKEEEEKEEKEKEKEKEEEDEDTLHSGEVDYIRVVFIRFLSKMDQCFGSMAEFLAGNEQHVLCTGWSQYLDVLKELYEISKIFDGAQEEFWRLLMCHRSMLSVLVVGFVKRDDYDHMWILENKSATNFECRRHLAMMLFPNVREDYGAFHEMLIDRSQLLAESFEYIGQARPESLRSGLFMEFKNEEATGPGVLREWFVLVCRAVFNPHNALFLACPNDCRRFYPNPASNVHPQHLEYFRFTGRIIALALLRKVQVGIVFDRVFFTQLAGNNVTLEDIKDADPYLYRSCKQILEMDADFIDSDALGLTFVRELEVLGCRTVVELCPGGRSLALNSKNRVMYVDLLIQSCFVTSISEQISHFADGFADIMSSSTHHKFFQSLELGDLDWMLHGSENTISIDDWKAHTKYNGYKETDYQISWFWEIVGRMSAKQRMILLFFWTSVQYLPVEGFGGLASPLYICRTVEPSNHLPSSHTCFYELCFPLYSSMSVMQERFGVITQEHIGCSFGTI